MTKANSQDLQTMKRRIILPDDVKKLLTMATEMKQIASGVAQMASGVAQMKSKADEHEGRLILLETTPEQIQPKTVVNAESVLPTIVKTTAKTKRKPALPLEIPSSRSLLPAEPHLPDPVRVPSPFGRSVNDPTESISRKYMNADQLHASKKSTRI